MITDAIAAAERISTDLHNLLHMWVRENIFVSETFDT